MNFENWRIGKSVLARAASFAFAGFFFFGAAGGACIAVASIFTTLFWALLEGESIFFIFFPSFHIAVDFFFKSAIISAPIGALMMFVLGIIGPPTSVQDLKHSPDKIFINSRAWKTMAFFTFSSCLSLCIAFGLLALFNGQLWKARNTEWLILIAVLVIGAMIVGMFFGGAWGLQDWRRDHENSK